MHDEAIIISKSSKYYGHQRGLASVVYKFFNKKYFEANTSVGAVLR